MTTYHEGDLFTETFAGFGDAVETPQRRVWPTVVALAVAAALVIGGLVWLKESPRAAAAQAVSATTLLSAFDRPQRGVDTIPDNDLDGLGDSVRPETTRLLLTDADGKQFVAVGQHGQLCAVTVPVGDLARISCVPSVEHTSIEVGDDLVIATNGTDPKLGDGWQNVQPNVWTKG
ncbi:hypothetical protein [Cellulomonas alba]|uniref:Uncharacterized protein n=1 Tax=Cellulomonas alba TaxID=3053467 RepID=A0ABT7SGJ3_9CELL|nr:hypothetical protein [Cellulomonas alba]MDM7855312.1 hypothetical protein [Cellulomonas alba]